MIAERYAADHARMVRDQIEGRGIRSPRVLDAFRGIPRHDFVPADLAANAYEDRPLQIGAGQTISQPYMVALMTDALALKGGEKVLEVGTGSGYQAAILSRLGARVYTIERLALLSHSAKENLERAGITDVRFAVGDGTLGWKDEAPFDRIVVTAGGPEAPIELLKQLGENGVLLIPIGGEERQELVRYRKARGRIERDRLCSCAFVKLIGQEGWAETTAG